MQQAQELKAGGGARRSRETRVSRQARVGIIANGKELVFPVHAPREIWTRWPDLRSARRRKSKKPGGVTAEKANDPILNGDALRAFVDELRSSEEEGMPLSETDQPEEVAAIPNEVRSDQPSRPTLRLVIWIGLGALALFGLFAVLR